MFVRTSGVDPIRAELFSLERLEQHAESLAAAQTVTANPQRGRTLMARLRENEGVIADAYRSIVRATHERRQISPAAEWLLDNFHVIDEQIREIVNDLPSGYYRKLPKLAEGPLAGYPRVFGIAWALVAHTDSALDVDRLTRFVDAYQKHQLLTIGELWAIAITLRLTLVENLRRLAQSIIERLSARRAADEMADRMLEPSGAAWSPVELDNAPWSTAFAVQLAQRLRDHDPDTTPALEWLNKRLAAEETDTEAIVRKEVQRQGETNVSVRNIITSMRLVSTINWAEWFESVSPVDRVLRQAGGFAAMDFPTRDAYRRAIEDLAVRSGQSEIEAAQRAVAAAAHASRQNAGSDVLAARLGDPGYYLIGDGRRGFEKALGYRTSLRTLFARLPIAAGLWGYVGLIAAFTAIALGLGLLGLAHAGVSGWSLVGFAIVGLVPASDIAVAIVNRAVAYQVGASLLPGLELKEGIPHELRTLVVVPSMLTSADEVERLVQQLEVHYLSNRDDNLHFAMLSDWRDSLTEQASDDAALFDAAAAGIERLNELHGPAHAGARFMLLHRKRLWNEAQGRWMGWERKRGKLHELNRLIGGAKDTTFLAVAGASPIAPPGIRYVITLDADTRLPIDAAKRLIGKLAHPLNAPIIEAKRSRVVAGHGILQPRVTPSLPIGREGSLYQRTFSGPNGLDPYAFAISDVYQDLFEEGSYVGKGIYDVSAFEAAMDGRIPENAVLSHDLLEGILARAGLATDVEVVEEFPSRYEVAAARQHRWVRGDWQLVPWIFGFAGEGRTGPGLPAIGRWKLLDNLRRSLSAPATLLALLLGWLLPIEAALVWTGFVVLTILIPPLLPVLTSLLPRSAFVSMRSHVRDLTGDLALAASQVAFLTTFLAHQAWTMIDAVARTLARVFIHRRQMLEWVTAAQAANAARPSRRRLLMQMLGSTGFAMLAGAAIANDDLRTWLLAAPFLTLWALSPLIALWASAPPPPADRIAMDDDTASRLRAVARRTWSYFQAFVGEEDNHLPPDNFQETPAPVLAHRTSPTNIGLYLLSIAAARDFGWLGAVDAMGRIESSFASMRKLERCRGHFYNWYDTQNLAALAPKYVSSVDSGNLAGHLIALANACDELKDLPVIAPHWREGLNDALGMIKAAAARLDEEHSAETALSARVQTNADACARLIETMDATPVAMAASLFKLAPWAGALVEMCSEAADAEEGNDTIADLAWAASALLDSVRSQLKDIETLVPWALISSNASGLTPQNAALLAASPTLDQLPDFCTAEVKRLQSEKAGRGGDDWARVALIEALQRSKAAARELLQRIAAVSAFARETCREMDFGFLFDPRRQLLSIGYRAEDAALDANHYDLLASEARLASFVAIAKGDVPASHWFRLGRTLTPIDGGSGLISWSGSMFEFLMPSLVMRAPTGSLLERTNRLIVRRQREYGAKLGVPWGMSESQYNVRNLEHTYQYASFGVPDLGYKRGLAENTVIAPYASALAAMIDPRAAAANFERLGEIGARGRYGWYEALDYTRVRLPKGEGVAVVRAFMAHHQAMSIVAIADALQGGVMRERFHAEPIIRSVELLLQERMPRGVAVARPPPERTSEAADIVIIAPPAERRFTSVHSPTPRTQMLSNGRYALMVTATGSGYSRWRDIALTRWREDPTCDNWGAYIFLRNVESGKVWSVGHQPSGVKPDAYEVVFAEDRVDFARRDGELTTRMQIGLSPEDDAEARRVSITNHGARACEIEVTSYAELALARQGDDVAHPAFAKLFVETEFVPDLGAIVATRRRRSSADPAVWAAHLAVVEGQAFGDVQYQTDRARFVGRCRSARTAIAMRDGWPLADTCGAVLDPVFALRRRLRIGAGDTAHITFWTMVGETRDAVLDLADKHHDAAAFDRATTLAWTQAQIELHHLGVTPDEAQLFQRLANHVHYSNDALRPAPEVLRRGAGKASSLWAHGISGDLPMMLARVQDNDDLDLVRQLLRAQEYWRLKRLAVDLVILNERPASYAQDFQQALDALIRMNRPSPRDGQAAAEGAVYALRADLIATEVQGALQSAARVVLRGDGGSLAEQLARARDTVSAPGLAAKLASQAASSPAPRPRQDLEFANGVGGFAADGAEYVVTLEGANTTPAPWVNVVANPNFGFVVAAEGGGCTWSENSQQNRLTPWSNDPVSDTPGEVFYLRDEETGEVWSATAHPIREAGAYYCARHGQGYSQFETTSRGIRLELLQYVPIDDPIKISRLTIRNETGHRRRLSVTAYVEWVLGTSRSASAHHISTEIDAETRAMFAANRWSNDFGDRVAFADWCGRQTGWTGDRTEFLGRDGGPDQPAGLAEGVRLSNRVGAGLDPCAALQTHVIVESGASARVDFLLGQGGSAGEARNLVTKYRAADLDAALGAVRAQWDEVLGAVEVRTPDRAMDILVNRWLLYQTLSCRVWARAGFYQSSGAYGFRDQLQDVMALCIARPDIARAHLLRAAGRQFEEGDVQHWWLPERGSGIRTRISDDRIWLAFVVAHYVATTGDHSVLSEKAPFLTGPELGEDQHDAFFEPTISEKQASLFDHCALALNCSLAVGARGLPLIGTGDWNDGMDRVGEEGAGESVWLAWFLYAALTQFAELADARAETEQAAAWRKHAAALATAAEQEAWDGDWYRRAFFDDGSPLGSVANTECRIDSIAQSWSVLSDAADPVRAARAMAAVDEYLIKRDDGLALLLTPPFDTASPDPGYIRGYPPGIRENGGQYTHAAAWVAQAFARLGEGDKAVEVLALINPINRTTDATGLSRYKTEPYAVCADIYSTPPHVGRGGWSWYTGSAAWTYRVAVEAVLGLRKQGDQLVIDPCIPKHWPAFNVSLRHGSSTYEITVDNPARVSRGVRAVELDGARVPDKTGLVALVDDGAVHQVRVVLGP
ncbi:MAG: glucoamylase family protein [Hyphomonadaceae bacterium]